MWLKSTDLGELRHDLPSCIYELSEDWRDLPAVSRQEATPVRELVSEVEPVLLYESLEALDSPVVRIQQQLSYGTGLTGPIPAVRTVNHHAHSTRHRLQ